MRMVPGEEIKAVNSSNCCLWQLFLLSLGALHTTDR
jgi:hypothetical protein